MTPRSLKTWAKLVAYTGAAQTLVQAIGFFAGILVIRLLPVHEYALYTLANTMLGTMTILADGGIASGVMSQGGKVWQDKQKLGAVLVTGMALRKKFAVFSLLVAVPILFYLLRKHEASWLMSGMIVLSLMPAFFASLSGALLEIPVKLHQAIKPLQTILVQANLGRLALLGLTIFVFPFAAMAIVCTGASQAWINWRLRKVSAGYSNRAQTQDTEVKKDILKIVSRVMPEAIYYCFSGQIIIWLLTLFGTTTGIAEVGALTRLAMAFNLFAAIANILVIPRFARLSGSYRLLLSRYFLVLGLALVFCLAGIFVAGQFSSQLLLILGSNYLHLKDVVELSWGAVINDSFSDIDTTFKASPLILMAMASGISLIGGMSFSLSLSRGIVMPSWFAIPYNFMIQIIFILLFDVTKPIGVLAVSMFVNFFQLVICIGYFNLSLLKLEKSN